MTTCAGCGFSSAIPFDACPMCGAVEKVAAGGAEPEDALAPAPTLATMDPEPVDGVATGMALFDRIGEGVVPFGAVILLTGTAGAGKSALTLLLADAWPGAVYYFPFEVKERGLKRQAQQLGIAGERIHPRLDFPPALPSQGRLLLVFDSLHAITPTPTATELLDHADTIITLVHRAPQRTAVVIGHETKDDKIAGPQTIAHLVDVVLSLRWRHGIRVFEIGKNRFGPSQVLELQGWPPVPAENA